MITPPPCRCGNTALLPINSDPSIGGWYCRVLVRHGDQKLFISAVAETERLAERDVEEQTQAFFERFHV